ncbi:MAG: hypothetical protein DDT19_00796 [Syntrophomonadaceae bacterium]|nr:hypothetical protein [Bacillota bacterium]
MPTIPCLQSYPQVTRRFTVWASFAATGEKRELAAKLRRKDWPQEKVAQVLEMTHGRISQTENITNIADYEKKKNVHPNYTEANHSKRGSPGT